MTTEHDPLWPGQTNGWWSCVRCYRFFTVLGGRRHADCHDCRQGVPPQDPRDDNDRSTPPTPPLAGLAMLLNLIDGRK